MLVMLAMKTLRACLTLLICMTLVFIVLRVSGDPATVLLTYDTPPAAQQEYRRQWGLDRPLPEQYLRYIVGLTEGRLRISFAEQRPAGEVMLEHLPNTSLPCGCAILFALMLGLPLGLFAALRHNTAFDRVAMGFAVMGFSLPSFFLTILLILLFSLKLWVLPSAGSDAWAHLVMPVAALGAGLMGKIASFVRTSMLVVLGQPYIRAARAKGVFPLRVILAHALPNAAIPILMFPGIEIELILTDAVVTETIFAWPGLCRVLVTAVGQRDLLVVKAAILLAPSLARPLARC